MKIPKIFIAHWERLIERKQNIIEQLKIHGLENFEFITDYDKDNWDINSIKKEYPKIFEIVEGNDPFSGIPYNRKLKYSEISLTLKHLKIIEEISEKFNWALILEDDATFCDNFLDEFEKSFLELPNDWDLAFPGGCCNLHAPTVNYSNSRVHKVSAQSRCTHGYLISNNCANKILKDLKYCNIASDYFLTHMAIKYNLNVYWFEPVLIEQFSGFTTTIQTDDQY